MTIIKNTSLLHESKHSLNSQFSVQKITFKGKISKVILSDKGKFLQGKHPLYKGVRKRRWGRWVAEIRKPQDQMRIWLGSFLTAEMAARAHDVASMYLRGDATMLNFPHLAESLPCPLSTETQDIRRAASAAAKDFHDVEPELELVERGWFMRRSCIHKTTQSFSTSKDQDQQCRDNGRRGEEEGSKASKSCRSEEAEAYESEASRVQAAAPTVSSFVSGNCYMKLPELDPFFYEQLVFNSHKALEEIAVAMHVPPPCKLPHSLHVPEDHEPWVLSLWD